MSQPGQINNSKIKKEESKLDNSKLTVSNTDNHQIVKNNKPTIAEYLQSKKGKYSLISLLVLSVLLISGLFTYNLLKQDSDTAKAANTTATAFNPSDCATYTSNGGYSQAGICSVRLYEKNGQLFKQLDVSIGEIVNSRLYYNNTSASSATNVNLTDSKPNFPLVGAITNNYVDAAPVTLNPNIFNGNTFSIAPGAGYFGYAADNTATSSNLEMGKKKYINGVGCAYVNGGGSSGYNGYSLLQGSNSPLTTGSCGAAASGYTLSSSSVDSIDITGKRYLNSKYCQYDASDGSYRYTYFKMYSATNATGVTMPVCANPTNGYSQTGEIAYNGDLLGNKFVNGKECVSTSTTQGYSTYQMFAPSNATGVDGACIATIPNYTISAGYLNNVDLSDTSRGYGYIAYSMQVPSDATPGTIFTSTASISYDNTSGGIDPFHSGNNTITLVSTPTPNITYIKLYSVDGGSTWSPTVSANPGQSVLVRLWNENTGGLSAASANIKDSLPNTFTYVAGSAKNCLNPSTTNPTTPDNTELVCDTGTAANKDTLFQTLTNASGVSPSAGLYDAAGTSVATGGTAFNATSGTKDIGKMRYLHGINCRNAQLEAQTVDIAANNTSTAFTSYDCGPGTSVGYVFQYDTVQSGNGDMLGKRYLHGINCRNAQLEAQTVDIAANNTSTAFTSYDCGPGTSVGYVFQYDTVQSGNGDMLGKRYLHGINCRNAQLEAQTVDIAANNTSTAFTSYDCGPGTSVGYVFQYDTVQSGNGDLLDATRSKSYIQYEMIIPAGTAGGNYGTQSTIASTATTPEFTSVNSGTNGSGITVTGDPAFSVKKLLALPTSGTGASAVCPTSTSSYSTTLSNTPAGSTICVRLAYQNKTSGAVSNAAITDTLSSGFTYINNTTSNCLTPATGNELCASDASQANTAWTGNNGWTGSNFALAPHAGLYGQPSTGASSVMEMGKKRYAWTQSCTQQPSSSNQEVFIQGFTNDNTSIQDTCLSTLGGFSTRTSTVAIPTLGNRYYWSQSCIQPTSSLQELFIQGIINSNVSITDTCATTLGAGSTRNSSVAIDGLGQRYFWTESCTQPTSSQLEIFDQGFTNTPAGIADTCVSTLGAGSVRQLSLPFDLLDPNNGTGYIQYKMLTPTSPTTTSVTLPNVSLSGDNQTTSTSPATINFATSPLTTADIPGLTVICGVGGTPGTVRVNTTTTCTFTLPTNKTLPNNFKLGIGNATPAGTCTVGTGINSSLVTCINVPTGTLLGTQPINGQIGTETITPTGETVNVIDSLCSTTNPCALFETALTYSPTQALAKRYGASGSTNSDNLILTLKDTRLEQSGFTTTCSIKYKFRTDTSYRTLTTNSTYNNTTGCTGNLLKANQLLFNVDFEITAITTNTTTNTTKNYLIYSNYDFKAGSIGVTSIGGSGL